MNRERMNSRIFYGLLFTASMMSLRCTSNKQGTANPEPVQANHAATSEPSAPAVDGDLPPELRDVQKFDPAASIDAEAVKNSDFYQVKKNAETNRPSLDADWKAQDELEKSVKKAKEDEEKRKKEDAKKEEQLREQSRVKSAKEYKDASAQRARYIREANEKVKKMPTISKREIMWNGLED